MEDDQKKWKTNQSTKINLIGCDTIVNSPSFKFFLKAEASKSDHLLIMCVISDEEEIVLVDINEELD